MSDVTPHEGSGWRCSIGGEDHYPPNYHNREELQRAADQPREDAKMRNLKIAGLVVPFLAAVVAANLIVKHYGPTSTPYVSFVLIGAALIFRDKFADMVGVKRIAAQASLIAAGALLTFLVNQDAALIAKASVVAFAASEAVEGTVYFLRRHRPWLERAPFSATFGAAVDSVLFITIAFGFSFTIAFAQFVAKVAGGYMWAWLIQQAQPEATWEGI